ncbi:hypothetical protein E4U41_005698 [Claviceps citrina]|nr:hypothetical protein E4U41_005698 [Claviceps citrina]
MSSSADQNFKALQALLAKQTAIAEEEKKKRMELEARHQRTTLTEYLDEVHQRLSVPLKVAEVPNSTRGTIPLPVGKYCPLRLKLWQDCPVLHQQLYQSVLGCLQTTNEAAPRLFPSRAALKESFKLAEIYNPISSESDLDGYESFAVNFPSLTILKELRKSSAARERFCLSGEIRFATHKNTLELTDLAETETENVEKGDGQVIDRSSTRQPRADRFFIRVVDDNTKILLTSGEHKPPHKLPMETIRQGLRPMDLWDHLVASDSTPTEEAAKTQYRAERLVCSAIVQQYHVMIQDGLEYSYVTNGLCDIHLWVPEQDPCTLYYYLYEPNTEVDGQEHALFKPTTAVARRLCLYLLSLTSYPRGQTWQNNARSMVPIWQTRYHHQTPEREQGTDSENRSSPLPDPVTPLSNQANLQKGKGRPGSSSSSKCQVSPAPTQDSPTVETSVKTRHAAAQSVTQDSPTVETSVETRHAPTQHAPAQSVTCRSVLNAQRQRFNSSSDSESETGPKAAFSRKRSISQATSSASTQPKANPRPPPNERDGNASQHDAQFCTLKCLLGLKTKGALDQKCPNVNLHWQGHDHNLDTGTHSIDAHEMVRLLKEQLEVDLEHNCSPFGTCGSYGAPFKLTLASHGYTVVGKGTLDGRLWQIVSREAEVYKILNKAQASAVTVFLGTISLEKMVYFLRGAGEIQHMLIMGWGGEGVDTLEWSPTLHKEVQRSIQEIRTLGIRHDDLRDENILWNAELQRALVIDFHRFHFAPRHPIIKRLQEGTTLKARAKKSVSRRVTDENGGHLKQ